ncbi:hypothetical protein [Streptomyces mayteni]
MGNAGRITQARLFGRENAMIRHVDLSIRGKNGRDSIESDQR